MERKLAAIFSADVKGYSRLMGEDEAATIRTLTAYRVAVALLVLLGGGVSVWQLVSRPLSPSRVLSSVQAPALPLPDKPSIAVLPFVNLSGDPAQEYFSDGMTEDLITDLSKLSGLFVIARNSAFAYKGQVVRPEHVSRELGVRYVVEGSVRKAGDRVRITAQLVDATTGYHRWAERYDRELQDIFGVQEEIAQKIVTALAVQLTEGEQARLGRKYTDNLEAYDYYLRGLDYVHRLTPEANAQARQMFERAISLDPTFAAAYTALSGSYWMDWTWRWSQDSRTLEHAFALALTGRLAEGRTLLEEALRESRRMGALYAQSHYLVRLSAVCLLEGAVMRLGSTRTRRSPWPGSTGSAGSRRSRSASSAPSTPKPSRRR